MFYKIDDVLVKRAPSPPNNFEPTDGPSPNLTHSCHYSSLSTCILNLTLLGPVLLLQY